MASVRKASSEEAQWYPRLLYTISVGQYRSEFGAPSDSSNAGSSVALMTVESRRTR